MNDLEGHSRSSELPLFDRPHISSNNDSVLHRSRNIATLTVTVTGCDLDKSLIFETTVEIAGGVSRVLSNTC